MTHAPYHITQETLLAHAAGVSGVVARLVIAAHLPQCPRCRRVVAAAEAAGGAMLDEIAPVPMSPGAFSTVMARL